MIGAEEKEEISRDRQTSLHGVFFFLLEGGA